MEAETPELTKDQIHEALSNTSVELHYMFWNVPREVQVKRKYPDAFSPLEILIHLKQVGQVYASRVKRIVDREEDEELPFMHDFDEHKQMSAVDIEEENVKYNLGQFMQARSQLLNKISFLDTEKWDQLFCVHEVDGEISLRELLIPLVKRELKHLAELKELIAL